MKKACRVFRITAAIAVGAGVISASGQEMDKKLNAFFQDYLETQFRHHPFEATQLGDHRFDSLLDDLSREALDARRVRISKALEALPKQIDYAQLSRDSQIDYEIFRQDLTRSIWLAENIHPYEEDPRVYGEYLSDSVYLLLTQSTLPKETNIANCLARMEQIPRVVAAAKANLRRPAAPLLETAIRQNQGSIAFYEKDLFEFAGKTPQLNALKGSAQRVAACLKDYQVFLEKDLLPRATGEWRLGREKFYRKLELEMDANLTADQVLADAQAEFERVQRDMYVVARQLLSGFYPGRALPPDDAAGRRETIQKVLDRIGQEHGRPENLTRDVRKAVAQIKRFISERDLLRLPDPDSCRIVEMPEFQRGNSTAYMNSPPPLDPKALGYYAVSPPPKDWSAQRVKSYLEEYNRYMLQILTIHEAYPGHYVQFEYANRNPSSIRRVLQSGVFVEGWAVYTEQTMIDEGYGKGDLPLRLTQLKFYLRAVANTILDHQMHCAEMTDDEALKFLTEQAYQSEGEARLKIIRSKQSPVQLSTYFAGRMAHYRLRQAVERELGANFDLGRYHEAVLAHGPVPVKYLPELVRTRLNQAR
ncbi:MAG: DUF885 domain-containing protein [Verrucomicrobia bacterium]|nr:DUF885 domain-containing protein [Verrucomicrobiota bacterium]